MPVPKKKPTVGPKNHDLSSLQGRWRSVIETDLADNQCLAWMYGTLEKSASGVLQIHWHFKIASGKYEGSNFQQIDGLETDNDLRILAQRLKVLGFEPQGMGIADLPKALDEIKSSPHLVRVSLTIGISKRTGSEPMAAESATESKKTEEVVKPKSPPKVEPTLTKGKKVWFVKGGKVHEGVVQSIDSETNTVSVKVDSDVVEVAATRCEIIT